MRRAFAYIDGFNLYHGMRSLSWNRFYWLDLWKLALRFSPDDSELGNVKYFTSMVVAPAKDPDKLKRQERYIDALRTLHGLEICLGHYMRQTKVCPRCKQDYSEYVEKSTDVFIATRVLSDAFKGNYDDLLLISGDGDLKEPLLLIHREFPGKRIIIVLPPNRSCTEFKRMEKHGICSCIHITQTDLIACQFPETVAGIHGYPLQRPSEWH